jgi:pyruvate/2-oxoglutarate dehydrogenase complex dihydrolipoamide dehydrogenase (E3) component
MIKFDYDLIIIGSKEEAIYAAFKAANLKSRVALVIDQNPDLQNIIYNFSFKREKDLYYNLSSIGVDIIIGTGEFVSKPKRLFRINNRKLKAVNYLIATGNKIKLPNLSDLKDIRCLTLSELWQLNLKHLPENIAIIGNNPQVIELSQKLNDLGKNVSLVMRETRLLPYFDSQASFLLQCHLEAAGIQIFTDAPWTQIKQIEQQKWLQVGNHILQVDEVIFAENYEPDLDNLNLKSWNVEFNRLGYPVVNKKLQSTHHNIYFCGDILGGYAQKNIAKYEADIAVRNSLFFPLFSVNYNYLPTCVFSKPNLAQVGLSEDQARRFYGDKLQVICEYFKYLSTQENSGFCKISCLNDGTILGCVIIGNYASEIIGAIALAMKKNVKLTELADFYYSSSTHSEIITKVAISGKENLFKNNKFLVGLFKTWFNWRKT